MLDNVKTKAGAILAATALVAGMMPAAAFAEPDYDGLNEANGSSQVLLDTTTTKSVEFDVDKYSTSPWYDGTNHPASDFTIVLTDHATGVNLVEGRDYTVTAPEDLKNAGEKEFTITGIGNYHGTTTITPRVRQSSVADYIVFDGNTDEFQWTGSGVEPAINTITVGEDVYTLGTDYIVSYQNNISLHENNNGSTPKAIVTPIANTQMETNLSGSFKKFYIVDQLSLSVPTQLNLAIGEKYAADKYNLVTPTYTITANNYSKAAKIDSSTYTTSGPVNPTTNLNALDSNTAGYQLMVVNGLEGDQKAAWQLTQGLASNTSVDSTLHLREIITTASPKTLPMEGMINQKAINTLVMDSGGSGNTVTLGTLAWTFKTATA